MTFRLFTCCDGHISFETETIKPFKEKGATTGVHPAAGWATERCGLRGQPLSKPPGAALGRAAGGSLHFSHLGTSGTPGE